MSSIWPAMAWAWPLNAPMSMAKVIATTPGREGVCDDGEHVGADHSGACGHHGMEPGDSRCGARGLGARRAHHAWGASAVTAVRAVWVTAVGGALDHAVTPADLSVAARRAAEGFMSLCGRRFQAAALIADPGPACASCLRALRARGWLGPSVLPADVPVTEPRPSSLATPWPGHLARSCGGAPTPSRSHHARGFAVLQRAGSDAR